MTLTPSPRFIGTLKKLPPVYNTLWAGRIDKAYDCYFPFWSYFELGELGKEWCKKPEVEGRGRLFCVLPLGLPPRRYPGQGPAH